MNRNLILAKIQKQLICEIYKSFIVSYKHFAGFLIRETFFR